MDSGAMLTGLLIVGSVAVIVFLLFREINLWYFKINDHLKTQDQILAELKGLRFELTGASSSRRANIPVKGFDPEVCPCCYNRQVDSEVTNCRTCKRGMAISKDMSPDDLRAISGTEDSSDSLGEGRQTLNYGYAAFEFEDNKLSRIGDRRKK